MRNTPCWRSSTRGLGSGNIDHRLRQTDFSDDALTPTCPSLDLTLPELETRKAVLLIGSNLRKDQPLLNLRVRRAAEAGAPVMVINPVDYEFNYRLALKRIANPVELLRDAARVAVAAAAGKGAAVAADIKKLASGQPSDTERAMAERLVAAGTDGLVLLGLFAAGHPRSRRAAQRGARYRRADRRPGREPSRGQRRRCLAGRRGSASRPVGHGRHGRP